MVVSTPPLEAFKQGWKTSSHYARRGGRGTFEILLSNSALWSLSGPLPQPSLCPDPYLGSVHLSSPHSCWSHHTFGLSRSRKTGLHSGPRGSWGGSGACPLQGDR